MRWNQKGSMLVAAEDKAARVFEFGTEKLILGTKSSDNNIIL